MLNYKDFINNGAWHEIYHLDDNWILKIPKKPDNSKFYDENTLKDFHKHIKFMKEYPEIFPKVKKLDKYRAAVEKMDTDKAKKEIKYIHNHIYGNMNGKISYIKIIEYLLYQDRYDDIELLGEEGDYGTGVDPICEKWYDFIMKLKDTFDPSCYPYEMDLHHDNFGLDKDGNIKLIDF